MTGGQTIEGKAELREQILSSRRGVSTDEHAAESALLGTHVAALIARTETVCAYVPVGSEPGSVELLDVLRRCAAQVLLPVAQTAPDGSTMPLNWGIFRPDGLVRGRWGLLEPAGPWLPPEAMAEASTILVPALAVDRFGARLGRGRGFYDHSLPFRDPQARLIAVVRDAELLEQVPTEPHDVSMTHALTPHAGLIAATPRR